MSERLSLDDAISTAKERWGSYIHNTLIEPFLRELVTAAGLIAIDAVQQFEREACATVAEEYAVDKDVGISIAIRERGTT
jgi:hypothetical protein